MRTLVDIDDEDVQRLDAVAQASKQSRAALIRQAITDFLADRQQVIEQDAFGLWGDRQIDGLAYQRKVRSEW